MLGLPTPRNDMDLLFSVDPLHSHRHPVEREWMEVVTGAGGCIVAHILWTGSFILIWPYFPPVALPDDPCG